MFHARIFVDDGIVEAIRGEEVKKYLSSKDLYVYTVGFDEGKVYVNKVKIGNGETKLEKLTEYGNTGARGSTES